MSVEVFTGDLNGIADYQLYRQTDPTGREQSFKMIVNDPENKQTVDTASGMFISRRKQRPMGDIHVFDFFERSGEKILSFESTCESKRVSSGRELLRYYDFQYFVTDTGDIKKYQGIIDELINVFQYSYGAPAQEIYTSGEVVIECVVDHSKDRRPVLMRKGSNDGQ